MKILLTGDPHVGKSTLLNEVAHGVNHKHGFVTKEVTVDGHRTGFELVSNLGTKALLASNNSASEIRVSQYGVNLEQFEDFLKKLGEPTKNSLLYIDEIGQMELFSVIFKEIVADYLDRQNPFIGTISSVYSDEFTESLMSRDDIDVIHITLENRDTVTANIKAKVAEYLH